MKKLKHILAISAIALMAVVFMPMLQGSDGQASADVEWTSIGDSNCRYKIETTGTGESTEVTLTIAPNDGQQSGTLPDGCEFGILEGVTANTITKVVIEEGVKPGNSTVNMFSGLYNCKEIQGISNPTFDTSNVTNMGYMFFYCSNLTSLDLSNFNTSQVTRMCNMFMDCKELTSMDLSNFDTTSVNDMSGMFKDCSKLTTILVGSGWSTAILNEDYGRANMFESCTNLKGGAGTTCDGISNIDATYARVDGGPTSETPGYLTKSPIYVDASSTAETPDGTAKKPYKTIQSAVNAASDGDTIRVKSGNYNVWCPTSDPDNYTGRDHNLFIGKNISIVGEDNVNLYSLQSSYSYAFDKFITVLISGTKGVVLDNLNIYPVYYSSEVSGLPGLPTVTESKINEISSADTLYVYYNQIVDTLMCYNGGKSTSESTIENVTVKNCTIGDKDLDVDEWGSAIYFNGYSNNQPYGISGGYLVEKNTLYGGICICEDGGWNATTLGQECIIRGNTLYDTIILNGNRPTGWNYKSITVKPTITGNTFNAANWPLEDEGVTYSYCVGARDATDDKVLTKAELDTIIANNTFAGDLEGKSISTAIGRHDYSTKDDEAYSIIHAFTPVASIGDTKYPTVQAAINAATEGQTITMIADSTENVSITSGKDITLDLNGHVLKGTGSGSVISNHGTLTIKDGNTETAHYFTYKKSGAWEYIPIPSEEQKTAADTVDEITDNTTVVKVLGGVITGGNVSNNGGGILTYVNSKLTMTGGTVCGNKADSDGGGIYTAAGVSVTLQNATIIGNYAKGKAGGVMLNADSDGSLNVGGTVNISGNTAGTDTVTDDNLTLWVPQTYTGPITIDADNPLSTGSNIHLSLKYKHTTGAVTTSNNTDYSKYFTSDNDKYYVKHVTGDTPHLELAVANVKIADGIENGKVSVSDQGAAAGATVTVTATPNDGYELDKITVTDKGGNDITTEVLRGTTITMPAAETLPITVSATFKIKQGPTPTPATKYTVTFDNQGHGIAPQSQRIEKGGKVSDPGSLKEEGFVFGGWFEDKACTDAWDFDNDTVTKSMTLYAKWTEGPQPAEAKDGLIATGTAKKTTNTIKWNAIDDADGYDVYYAKCGNSLKKVKSTTSLKYTKKGLNKKKYYKYRVKAYEKVDGKKVYLATSPVIHIAGVSTKYSNATKVTASPDGMNIEAGDTDKITAKITKTSSKKTVLWKNHVSAKIRYMSSDKNVVTVDSKGNVTAIGKGEAYVYAYAASGAFAKITVTVQ